MGRVSPPFFNVEKNMSNANGTVVRATDTDHPAIRIGSSGPNVIVWQKVIGVTADGKFGPATDTATRAWQTSRGLKADGIVGPMTWKTAGATPIPAAITGISSLGAKIMTMPTYAKAGAGLGILWALNKWGFKK